MSYYSKSVIVWIDDHFLTPTFQEDKQKNAWHKLFGKINSNLYRLLNIEIKYIRTAKEAGEYIKSEQRFRSNIYYYFIVDRKLPFDIYDDAVDSNSEDIIKYLKYYQKKYNCLDFSVLSSGSPESYAIKNIDYHLKPQNKEFTLPNALRHKILLNIKENIVFIDQYDLFMNIKLNQFGSSKVVFDEDKPLLFPFIGKYKSFVELEEIGKKDFSTLIVSAPLSISSKFILQSALISLYDHLKEYNGINYYEEDSYDNLKLSGNFEALNELTDQIAVIRLNRWDIDSYKNLNTHLKYKHIKVFIIDSHDDNLSNYIDNTSNVKIVKVDTVSDNIDISKNILLALTKQYLNGLDFDLENTIYNKNNILFIHPLIYTMVSSTNIQIENFDDPSEIIDEITKYLKSLELKYLGDADHLKKDLLKSKPFTKFDSVYAQVESLCKNDQKYSYLVFETIKYWLNNSWNINYNVDVNSYDIYVQETWQKRSFEILVELIKNINFKLLDNEKDISDIKQIKETIEYFHENIAKNKVSPSKVLWPHEKFPMSTYIQNELFKSSNKKLYIQDKDLNFIDDSIELENSFKSLEYKIEYYRSIFNLIENTVKYMPNEISNFILDITKRIQDNDSIFIDKLNNDVITTHRENFKKLANTLFRIAINFGMLILDLDKSKLSYQQNLNDPSSEDTAGLGKLLSDLRDHIYAKSEIFTCSCSNIKCSSYIDSAEHVEFMSNYNKLFSNTANKNLLFEKDSNKKKLFSINKDKNIASINKEKVKSAYLNKLYISNNITMLSQISNLTSYLMQNEQQLKIQKHMGAYSFFAYLADTRNTWEHGDDKAWNRELFIESFIYGYESIWLMQRFILENMYGIENLPESSYVKLDDLEISAERKETFLNSFKTINEYQSYFDRLYKKQKKEY